MKNIGIALIAAGVLLVGGALVYSPTVSGGGYGEVYNLGALQFQALVFQGGAAAFLAGCVLFAVGELIEAMARAGTAKAAEVNYVARSDDERTEPTGGKAGSCDWCGRTLEWPYVVCTSHDDATLRKLVPQVRDKICLEQYQERGVTASR